jgi:hypothetical protein
MKPNPQSTQLWRIKLKKKTKKPSYPELNYQTHDMSHDIMITSYKSNIKKQPESP